MNGIGSGMNIFGESIPLFFVGVANAGANVDSVAGVTARVKREEDDGMH